MANAVVAYLNPDMEIVDFDKAKIHSIESNSVVAHKAMSVTVDMGNFRIDKVNAGFDKAMLDSNQPMNYNRNLVTLVACIDQNTMEFSY